VVLPRHVEVLNLGDKVRKHIYCPWLNNLGGVMRITLKLLATGAAIWSLASVSFATDTTTPAPEVPAIEAPAPVAEPAVVEAPAPEAPAIVVEPAPAPVEEPSKPADETPQVEVAKLIAFHEIARCAKDTTAAPMAAQLSVYCGVEESEVVVLEIPLAPVEGASDVFFGQKALDQTVDGKKFQGLVQVFKFQRGGGDQWSYAISVFVSSAQDKALDEFSDWEGASLMNSLSELNLTAFKGSILPVSETEYYEPALYIGPAESSVTPAGVMSAPVRPDSLRKTVKPVK
jgi:hypothetical protein